VGTRRARGRGPEGRRGRAGRRDALTAATEKRYETEVALDRVSNRYGPSADVLNELSWTFGPEQLHVVAGPSGSGTTTILNLIAGLEQPDDGEVWLGASASTR
jgi:ABC-type bacteriocin/lantibiotic exporter with double-glycine peptidase domain